ncbi:stalk domain-containing protein [Paenibacillus sp. FSL W8-0919]|uniref:stalk domain-containing protein n=1 Tax=Paenibacillus sp. FSL W8-0919 TaxID=2954707 RepID=UPI0030F9244E
MKKSAYVFGGVLIGLVLTTSASVFADSVKSMIGKKVTGEYTVIVNGQKLTEKGAIIDGKANVPVRAVSESLGADIKVSGKTITITTESAEEDVVTNRYSGQSRSEIKEAIRLIHERILEPTLVGRDEILAEIARLEKEGASPELIESRKKQLTSYETDIAAAIAEIAEAEAALAALK